MPVVRVVVLVTLVAFTTAGREFTTCDLSRADLDKQTVSVSARVGFTSHGIFLLSDGCPKRSDDVVLLFPGGDDTPQVDFEVHPQAIESLRPFLRPTGGTATACAVLTGELQVKKKFRLTKAGAGPVGNGFGPRGAFRRGFVLREVDHIRPCE